MRQPRSTTTMATRCRKLINHRRNGLERLRIVRTLDRDVGVGRNGPKCNIPVVWLDAAPIRADGFNLGRRSRRRRLWLPEQTRLRSRVLEDDAIDLLAQIPDVAAQIVDGGVDLRPPRIERGTGLIQLGELIGDALVYRCHHFVLHRRHHVLHLVAHQLELWIHHIEPLLEAGKVIVVDFVGSWGSRICGSDT
uniref:Uncharacterized protein n=1 Tax=Arundo donax TaxID=35708 RepID=A0A0A8ZE11_ARUDO